MPKVGPETLATIQLAFQVYKHELTASNLSDAAKYDYDRFVDQFIRWLKDEFKPGAKLN